MRWKIKLLVIFGLSISLLFSSSCKRSQVEEPSPVGPSTLSVILKLTTTTNVLFAGLESRPTTTITANLTKYDGIPIANRTIHFEIRDANGFPVTIGFFDGNQSSKTVVTNSDGEAQCQYYGPIATELTSNIDLFIYAIVAGEGKEYIWERTPLYVIRDVIEFSFNAYADPNVLWCTSEAPESKINAVVKLINGVPCSGAKVLYKITNGKGEFENGLRKITAYTDSQGVASVTYIGPTKSELPTEFQWVTIRAILQNSGINSDDIIYEDIQIRLEKGDN